MFSFYSSFVGLIFSETLYSMLLVYMIKANDFRSSIRRHGTSNRNFSHSNLFSKKIHQHVQQMPFFENTEILRRDVQVLDHILTMEIKTHFILNLPRPKITTANACATRPLLPLGFTGGEDATNILTIIFRSYCA